MRKVVGVLLLSLTLLGSAHVAFGASEEEKVLMRLETIEKQVQMLQSRIKSKMMEGKMMTGTKMKDAMKSVEMMEKELDRFYRLTGDL